MFSATPKALVVYSSPADQRRLRVDKEHRALDEVLRHRRLNMDRIRRIHATTLGDFIQAIREEPFEILQFSGHGDPRGIYLEDETGSGGSLVNAETISAFIQDALPKLRVAIFVSCYSAESLPHLLTTAPFVITVQGLAEDEAAIRFISSFYDEYFRYNAVEPAFQRAVMQVNIGQGSGGLSPVLTRRGKTSKSLVVQACFDQRSDSILIDIEKARSDLDALGVPLDQFLTMLTRKIRLHRWVFRSPRSQAPLPIGDLIGLFSWEDAEDLVVCDHVMRVRTDIGVDACESFVRLMVGYNDLCCEHYRVVPKPSEPQNERLLKKAIDHAELQATKHLSLPSDLEKLAPQQFKISRANIIANLSQAETRFHSQDFERTVMYLELVLTSFHDLVNHLSGKLTEPSR